MKSNKQIITQRIGKDTTFLKFTRTGAYEYDKNNQQYSRKIFSTNQRLTFRLITLQTTTNDDYRFVVMVNQKTRCFEISIDSKENIQSMWKLMNNCIIMGLRDMIVSLTKIGEGAFSQVFEAKTIFQTRIALKCFQKQFLYAQGKNYEIFNNQISLMKKLSSKFIVSYDYLFETEQSFYLKMEYFPYTLREKLKSSKIMAYEHKNIMRQLLEALIELKSKGIVHRDIKPANIMIRINEKTGEEQCVLIDFGLATDKDASPYLLVRCGTPGYMSPQVSNAYDDNSQVTCASDMFSLGCVFYKMITGKSLFSAKTPQAVLKLNKRCKYRPNSFEMLSIQQSSLLNSMLEKDPNKRITPEQALQHCYFDDHLYDLEEIPDEDCLLQEKCRRILPTLQIKNMQTICSSASSEIFSIEEKAILKFYCRKNSDLSSNTQESQGDLRKEEEIQEISTANKSKRRRSRFSQLKNIQLHF